MKFGRRLLIVLAVLLPVPLAAASGLAIPLPATVERLAAKLVPFADPASLGGAPAFAASSRGRIVVTEDEVTLTNLLTANTTANTAVQKVSRVLARKARLRRAARSRNGHVKSGDGRIKKERSAHGNRPVRAKREHKAPKPRAKPPKPPKKPKASTPEAPLKLPAAQPKSPKELEATAPKPPREKKKA